MNGLSKLPVRFAHSPQQGGLGALPQKIFVVTCSEIDSNNLAKEIRVYCCFEVLVVKPHLHLKMSYKMHCFEL